MSIIRNETKKALVLASAVIFIQLSPWQLFQRLCPLYSPYSYQCQQQQQQLQQQQLNPAITQPPITPTFPPDSSSQQQQQQLQPLPQQPPLPNDAGDGEGVVP